ncbi:MAG TPA: SURF1 family protein [Brevundimonas sp.]|nr:SURF1 family protein [Brevundimonas sp.]
MAEGRVRFPWGLTIASGLSLVLLCALGTWQVQRLHWKETLIAEAEAAAAKAPVSLYDLVDSGEAPEFRRVTISCPGLATAPYVELQTIQDGQVGVRLISACPILKQTGMAIAPVYLVDRGFVADTVSSRPPEMRSADEVRIIGELRTAPPPGGMAPPPDGRRFYARDMAGMARALNVTAETAPQTLYALSSTNPEWRALEPSAPPAAFSNNHLGYALTWFGLALALAGTYVALLRRKLRPSTPPGDTEKSSS